MWGTDMMSVPPTDPLYVDSLKCPYQVSEHKYTNKQKKVHTYMITYTHDQAYKLIHTLKDDIMEATSLACIKEKNQISNT